MKELKFDDVFKPPFKVYYPMIFDSKERISLTAICSEEIAHRIILKLNGKTDKKLKNGHVSYCDGELFFNKDGKSIKIMLVRGWGRLTGIGGLKLDEIDQESTIRFMANNGAGCDCEILMNVAYKFNIL